MDRQSVTQKRDMSTRLSGTMLFEQLVEMNTNGLLSVNNTQFQDNCSI